MKKLILMFLAFIFLFTLSLSFVSALPCNVSSDTACGEPITVPDYGAVELCNDCFVCGLDDGVCPAWYSTGDMGDNITVLLRKGISDRPNTNAYIAGNHFETPAKACEYFGGDVLAIEAKSNYDDAWGAATILEDNIVLSLANYVRVNCTNVSARPSCDKCVDPDCHTVLKGVAYAPSQISGGSPVPIENVNIQVLARNNESDVNLVRSNVSNADGSFEILEAYSGEVNVYCSAAGFESVMNEVTLLPGYNIVDCRMDHGTCDADCTIPSAQYGVRVCSRNCQGIKGCDFNQSPDIPDTALGIDAEDLMDACDGRLPGTFRELNVEVNEASGDVTFTGVLCCTDYPEVRTFPLFNIYDSDGITNLLTRRFNKLLPDGSPVFLNIIVYNKK